MTKYLLGLISLCLMCSCSDTAPGETPPIDPPTPTPTVTITKPEFVFGFQGQSKYSYCPSALKQADGTVHLYFCGNPENLIMVDNIPYQDQPRWYTDCCQKCIAAWCTRFMGRSPYL